MDHPPTVSHYSGRCPPGDIDEERRRNVRCRHEFARDKPKRGFDDVHRHAASRRLSAEDRGDNRVSSGNEALHASRPITVSPSTADNSFVEHGQQGRARAHRPRLLYPSGPLVRGRRLLRPVSWAASLWCGALRHQGLVVHQPHAATDRCYNLNRWLDEHPDQANRLFGAFCWAPLHSAARFGREDLAELLIARGADVRTPDEPSGSTALHLAAQYGEAGVAKVLVAKGADVNAKTKFGKTPLHDAVDGLGGTSNLEGRVSVVQLLLANGADVNARERGSNRTALDHAAASSANQANSERMTQLLLTAGANPRTTDSQGESPLHQAAVHGNLTAVRRLLDSGADTNAAGRDTTPLGTAAAQGHVEVVTLLLSRGADASRSVPGSRLEGDGAPLAMAFLQGRDETRDRETRRLEVARLLLDRGARIDARDQRGSTVLHTVALQGNLAAVELLVSRRAIDRPGRRRRPDAAPSRRQGRPCLGGDRASRKGRGRERQGRQRQERFRLRRKRSRNGRARTVDMRNGNGNRLSPGGVRRSQWRR